MSSKQNKQAKRKSRRQATVNGESKVLALRPLVPASLRGIPRSVFPQLKRCVLRYSDSWSLLAPAASTSVRTFQANSLYDFDLTGTGHQPRYYDQLTSAAGPYTVYRVLGSRIKLGVYPTTEGGATPQRQNPVMVCAGYGLTVVPVAPSGSVSSNIWPFTEIPGWLGVVANVCQSKTLEFNRTSASVFGVPEQHILGEDNYQGVYNANPTNLAYFHVAYQCSDFSAAQTFCLTLSAEFDVQFEDPFLQANS